MSGLIYLFFFFQIVKFRGRKLFLYPSPPPRSYKNFFYCIGETFSLTDNEIKIMKLVVIPFIFPTFMAIWFYDISKGTHFHNTTCAITDLMNLKKQILIMNRIFNVAWGSLFICAYFCQYDLLQSVFVNFSSSLNNHKVRLYVERNMCMICCTNFVQLLVQTMPVINFTRRKGIFVLFWGGASSSEGY